MSQAPPSSERGQRAARNVGWGFLGQSLGAGLSFVWLLVIPRLMGAETYGNFLVVTSLVMVLLAFSGLGTGALFARYLPRYAAAGDAQGVGELFTGMALVRVGVGLVCGGVAVGLVGRLLQVPLAPWLPYAVGAAVLLAMCAGSFSTLMYGRNQVARWAALGPAIIALQLALVAGLYVGYGLEGAILGVPLAHAASLGAAMYLSRPWPWLAVRRIRLKRLGEHLQFGLLASTGGLILITLARGGQVALAEVGVAAAVIAKYGIACNLAVQLSALIEGAALGLMPGLSQLVAEKEDARAQRWVRMAVRYETAVAVVAAVVIGLVAKEPLLLALGADYQDIWPAMLAALAALPLLGYLSLARLSAAAWGRPGLNLETWLVVGVVFVPLVTWGAQEYGPVGGTAALALAALVGGAFLEVRLRRVLGLGLMEARTAGTLLLLAPGAGLVWWCEGPVQGAIGAVGFVAGAGALLWGLKVIDPEEVREAKRALWRQRGARVAEVEQEAMP